MKREELLAKGYTEEQVTDLLNAFHNANNEVKKENENLRKVLESKNALEEQNQNLQKQLDAINEANLTEQEKIAKEREEAERYLSNAKKINNTAKAKEILAGLDIDDTLVATLVSDDEQATINNANLLKAKIENVREVAITTTKEQLANIDVKPNPSNIPQDEGAMTLDKLNAMSLTDQLMFKRENPDVYAELTK
jgi:hypothetical protein